MLNPKHPITIALYPIIVLMIYIINDSLLNRYKGDDVNLLLSLSILFTIIIVNIISYFYINKDNKYRDTEKNLYSILTGFIQIMQNSMVINSYKRNKSMKEAEEVWYIIYRKDILFNLLGELDAFQLKKVKIFVIEDLDIPDIIIESNIYNDFIYFSSNDFALTTDIFIINPISRILKTDIYQKLDEDNEDSFFIKYDETNTMKVMGLLIQFLNNRDKREII